MPTVPVRRTTRTTRSTTQANENANARPSRMITRSKAAAATVQKEVVSRVTAPTQASRAKTVTTENAAGKRKRDVLVEVTGLVANKNAKGKSSSSTAKGKGKGKAKVAEPETKPTLKTSTVNARENAAVKTGIVTRRALRPTSTVPTASELTAIPEINAKDSEPPAPLKPRSPVFTRPPEPPRRVADEAEDERAIKRRHTEQPLEEEFDLSQIEADDIAIELQRTEAEEEPRAKLWDDLDAEDWDDPFMVSEYVVEICQYLKEIELSLLPNANYMDMQPELDWEKRGILVDWILQVHARFHLLQETLFLFINILDRFLSLRPISLSKLQLVGMTAFLIAAKYEETYSPSVSEIAFLSDGQYTAEEVQKAERYVLKTIGWDMRYSSPLTFLRRGSKADHCDTRARTIAKYLIEIALFDPSLVATPPSLLAAAGLWLGRLVLGRVEWTPNLEHYSTYSEAELLPTANLMLNYILQTNQYESLYKKYAHKRYLKCSIFMRQWAIERWGEDSKVRLERELPVLKEELLAEQES